MSKIDNPMAKADPDDSPRNTIADALHEGETIRGYGRRQHGLNGKDADLDNGGQCVVKALYVYEDKTGLRLGAKLTQYANICEARSYESEQHDKELREQSEAIVMGEDRYNGEWTGSDYWTFSNDVDVSVPISDLEYDDDALSQRILDRIAKRLVKAINKTKEVREFERTMSDLNKILNLLHKEVPA